MIFIMQGYNSNTVSVEQFDQITIYSKS